MRSSALPPAAEAVVTVATVTYGQRWRHLERLLDRLAGEPAVARVLVIDNASTPPVAPRVAAWARERPGAPPVEVLTEVRNTGSAAAFGRALRHALEQPAGDFVYLLDDDNLPAERAFAPLLARSAALAPTDVLLSLRSDRSYLSDAVARRQPLRARIDSFCGHDLRQALARRLRRGAAPPPADDDGSDLEADYAPYGGMWFRRELPSIVGYPNRDFFLYGDDHEYTHRIRAAGGRLRICADSRIDDMEPAWFDTRLHGRIPAWFAPDSPELRIFYSVRNQVALERAWLVRRPLRYFGSGLLAVLRQALLAWSGGVPVRLIAQRLRLLWRATRRGWTGQLGEIGAEGRP